MSATTHASSTYVPQLSPLASMVLNSSDIAYKAFPHTPSPKASQAPSLPTPALSASPEHGHAIPNGYHLKQDQLTPISSQQFTPSRKTPVVVIAPLPTSSQPGNYQPILDSPKRRKLDNDNQSERVAIHVRAQKDEADALLLKFQNLLSEIFEAQDQLVPDTSNISSQFDSQFFEFAEDVEDSNILLTTKIHSKLQNAIRKLIDYRRFTDVAAEDIKRLQRLCEPSLSAAQSINLGIDGSGDEAEQWQVKLKNAENGASSACTVIWTILGSLQEKELFPEDMIQCLPNVLTNVFENCLIPVVEARSDGRSSNLFRIASESKETLGRLLGQGKKLLDLIATLCVKIEGAEGAISATEFLASKLIFAENSYNEKESVLGFQAFENVRRTAMEALAKIFARFPEQRSCILDEILVSLEKLPSTNRAARQFKLIDGKNIQLLSALVMQLVQTTASESPERSKEARAKQLANSVANGNREDDSDADEDELVMMEVPDQSQDDAKSILYLLNEKTAMLQSNSTQSAKHIIGFFVQRAMTTTKTGDKPYRNLLDLFTEDLINVLGSTDWPSSELLLYILALHLLQISRDDKVGGSAKNMAIELLGWMGTAISNLRVSIPRLSAAMHDNQSQTALELEQFADDQVRGSIRAEDIVAAEGPYRMTLEYLHARAINDWQLSSAQGFCLLQWSKAVCSTFKLHDMDQTDSDLDPEIASLAQLLHTLQSNPAWIKNESGFGTISPSQCRLAYTLTVLNMNFCKLFEHIVMVLLSSITSDQAKSRSRSLKSVISMLETDPSLLDRDQNFIRAIFKCTSDPSPMVRDSALSLIAKCMSLKPGLEEEACKVILSCAADPTVGVRKRSIGFMKDIYLHDTRQDLKGAISKSLLERTSDLEESVATLARQTLKEIWVFPLLPSISSADDSAKARVAILVQTELIIATISLNAEILCAPLETFFRTVLKEVSKDSGPTLHVCKTIVANLFDRILSTPQAQTQIDQEKATREGLLLTLVALAKADPKLVVPEQLKALQPYVSNLSGSDDLLFFRSVVTVYRCVLPYLSSTQQTLLGEIQGDLFKTIAKLPRPELNEVMACLWTINGVLKNTERLVRLTVSASKNIKQASIPPANVKSDDLTADQSRAINQLRSYIRILGCAGKNWDLEHHKEMFKQALPTWQGDSVAGLMVDLICPWATANQQASVRNMALESLGAICQSWPGQFNKEQVRRAFSNVFREDLGELLSIVLKAFAEFFGIREGAIEAAVEANKTDQDQEEDLGRLGGSLKASDRDGAAAWIAQHYLDPMVNVAMTRQDSNALTSMKVIASINRQGLRHPKETAGALVALETSTDPEIANTAYESHKLMHTQHETLFEKEYMRAVQEAFLYQKNVVKDSSGATTRPFQPKLAKLFEIVGTSNAKYVRKFLSNLIYRTNFDISALNVSEQLPEHVLFVRFISQNLAYFEYGKMDEIYHTILHLENVVGKTGTDIAQAIETTIRNLTSSAFVDAPDNAIDELQAVPPPNDLILTSSFSQSDLSTLKPLVAAAMILTMLWEIRTYLRRQYGITKDIRQYIGKGSDAKELSKAPTKVHGVTGDRMWDSFSSVMVSLQTPETMMTRCYEFMNLMNVDEEVKVAADDDDTRDAFSASVGPDGEAPDETMGGKGSGPGKRKSTASVGGTPKRKRGRPSLKGRRKSSINLDDEEDGDWD